MEDVHDVRLRHPRQGWPAPGECTMPTPTDRPTDRAVRSADAHETGSGPEGVWACAPLEAAERAFALLTTGPAPLAVDGAVLGHRLPRRLLPLDELRDLLLSPGTGHPAREAIWRVLVRNAQTRDAAWVVGAAGVAMPGLRNVAAELAAGYDGEVADLDAEVLVGFTERLKTIDPDAGSLAARLVWAAQRAGARLRAAEWDYAARHRPRWESFDPPDLGSGHPDLVLAEAIREGVLTEWEAGLIGATRLENTHLSDVARTLGVSYWPIFRAREKAEFALAEWLCGTRLTRSSGSACKKAA